MADTQYSGQDIAAAYKAIYGKDIGSVGSGLSGQLNASQLSQEVQQNKQSQYAGGALIPVQGGGTIPVSQLMYMYQQGKGGTQAATTDASTQAAAAPSYLTGQGNASMATNSIDSSTTGQPQVTPQQAIQYFVTHGGSPNVDANTAMAYFAQANPNFGQSGVSAQDAVNYFIQRGGNPNVDAATAVSFYEQAHPDELAKGVAQAAMTPEQRALGQIAQTDPQSEALRQQVAGSYADPGKAATAADYQSYLDTFKAVDPEEFAQRQGLATSMDSYLKSAQDQYALGSQLDPITQMQVEQQARKAQADRGNLYGAGQAAVEAMTIGQAGQALQQQRLGNLQTALGGQQSYLGAGLGMGDTAMQLYQQGLQNKANQQQSALSYLGSGQTPYQTGASYLSAAEQNAANAAQGGPQYNPTSLGQGQLGTAQQAPQYGLDVGQQAQNWYNSLSAYSGAGTPAKNQMAGAAAGALGGAASGALSGSAAGPYGALIGAGVGAVAGGAKGYYS
jgi:hypothetical protein